MDRNAPDEPRPRASDERVPRREDRRTDKARPRRDSTQHQRDWDSPRRERSDSTASSRPDRPRRDRTDSKVSAQNDRPRREKATDKEKPQQERPRRPKQRDPELPEDVTIGQLDRAVRQRLRGLSKEHAERVGKHLVMAGNLLWTDPDLAYEHAQAAVRHASRIDVVREAAGLTAYRTGRYQEALSELRTARRLSGSSQHLPILADAERGLGRPQKAIDLANSQEAATLDLRGKVELAIVHSGARADLSQWDAALAALDKLPPLPADLNVRVLSARAGILEAAGRSAEAAEILAGIDPDELAAASGEIAVEADVVVFDALDDEEDGPDPAYMYLNDESGDEVVDINVVEDDGDGDEGADGVSVEGDSGDNAEDSVG